MKTSSQGLAQKIRDYALVGALLTSLGAAVTFPAYNYFATDTVRTKIIDTQTKRYHQHDKYLVFTEAGVFENTDAWYRGKFRASDLQGRVMQLKGKDVEITKYGWRNGFFSWYQNITKVNEVKYPSNFPEAISKGHQ